LQPADGQLYRFGSGGRIAAHGSARSMLVNYLLPGFALVYGATILGEPLTVAKLAGLALILLGVTLASGIVVWGRRAAAAVR
jgi:drug/metabolite transporter (DMT)-like permease